MNKVRISPFLPADAEKIDGAVFLVYAQRLRDITLPRGDWIFQLACFEIVEVKVAPIVALGEPNHFFGRGKESPIWPIVATFEVGIRLLLDNITDFTRGVGDT